MRPVAELPTGIPSVKATACICIHVGKGQVEAALVVEGTVVDEIVADFYYRAGVAVRVSRGICCAANTCTACFDTLKVEGDASVEGATVRCISGNTTRSGFSTAFSRYFAC